MSRQALSMAVVCVVLAAMALGALLLYARIGRTPGEIIDHAQSQLTGNSPLEVVVVRGLDAIRRLLDEPASGDSAAPFMVPPLSPNPGLMQQPAGAHVDGPSAALPAAPHGTDKVIRVGPQRAIKTIAMAAKRAEDGSVIEIDPGDYIADVAVWDRAELTLRGMGSRVRLIASGRHAEGKAIWVIRRGKVTVEGIDFIGARVPDRNGAGIRFEGGHLVVRHCTFIDNQNGILSTGDPDARLEIENSEFGYNGAGDGLSHGVYAGPIAYLRITGSYFHHANVGHLIKSRAKVNRIDYNRLTDESGGRASYELEFANGGIADVVGNIIQQGQETRNSVMVSYGAEGYPWPQNRLRMTFNTLVNDRQYGGTFVRVSPGPAAVMTGNNLWVGSGRVDASPVAVSSGDHQLDWDAFVRPSRGDYRLTDKAAGMLAAQPLPAGSQDMVAAFEYQHPVATRALTTPPRVAGALQAP